MARDTTLHLLQSLGLVINFEPRDGFSGVHRGQQNSGPVYTQGQGGAPEEQMPMGIDFKVDSLEKTGPTDRETPSHSTSIHLCSTSSEVLATRTDPGNTEQKFLRMQNIPGERSPVGIGLVDPKHQTNERESHPSQSPRDLHVNRCGKREIRGVGSGMPGDTHQGNLEKGGKRPQYQRPGTTSSGIRLKKFPEGHGEHLSPPIYGQHLSPLVHSQNGGDGVSDNDRDIEENLDVLELQKYLPNSGVCSIKIERGSRLAVQELEGCKRMETRPQGFSSNMRYLGDPGHRSLCIPNVSSDRKLFQLDARSSKFGNRRPATGMEFQPPLRVSPLLSDRTGFEACKIAGYHNDHDYASMGIPDLVPLSSGNVHRPTLTTETLVGSSKEPQGRVPPSNQEWHDEAGSLASVRKRMFTKKISDTATNLIARAKSRGTRSNYDSAWRKFTGWCSGREINPFSCPLGDVLDYLGHMFEKQYKYRTINNHRSAISAYHRPIDGMKVGSHPYVTDLMKGVNNERPPLPKYRFIWDVELVLGKMKQARASSRSFANARH